MCGIFAYSGPSDPTDLLLDGLKDLEYRGYDSAGLAFFDQAGRVRRLRVCDGVKALSQKVKQQNIQSSPCGLGIAHTRWATHGPPSEKNAHPHRFGSVYAVHNGVIENEAEIKSLIKPKRLLSDTDTELIPCLIDHFRQTEGLDFLQSALKTARKLKGAFAVALIDEQNPGHLLAFKMGPPLVFGRNVKRACFIASDPGALASCADKMIILEDEELLEIKGQDFKFFNFKGSRRSKRFQKHLQEPQKANKGRFPHFMLKEIFEQPEVIRRLIQTHRPLFNEKQLSPAPAKKTRAGEVSLQLEKGSLKDLNSAFKKAPEILILACGSSWHAGLWAKYILEEWAGVKVSVETASEFVYRKSALLQDSLALFISQSGETADILSALKITSQKKLKSLSLCNVAHSSLERKTDFSLKMMAGPEIAVAATKSFSASLVLLSFLSSHLCHLKGLLPSAEQKLLLKELSALPDMIHKLLSQDKFFLKIMQQLKKFKKFFYLGRGPYYPLALEGALKLKEIAYLHAEAWPAGEMKHGPLAMIDSQSLVTVLLPSKGDLYKKSLINLKEAKARGASIISIGGNPRDKAIEASSSAYMPLPETHSALKPLLALPLLQMMAYYIARSYGYNVDRPRNLAKSVTVE